MRRNDTQDVGRAAEELAAVLLENQGFTVHNLNNKRPNYPVYDLAAAKAGVEILVSVKCARAKRELRLGKPRILERLADASVVMAFLPASKGSEIAFTPGGYELLIIPGPIAREEALAAHRHYAATHPGSANHPVMVKDKVDRSESTISGAVFARWHQLYQEAWSAFDMALQARTVVSE